SPHANAGCDEEAICKAWGFRPFQSSPHANAGCDGGQRSSRTATAGVNPHPTRTQAATPLHLCAIDRGCGSILLPRERGVRRRLLAEFGRLAVGVEAPMASPVTRSSMTAGPKSTVRREPPA